MGEGDLTLHYDALIVGAGHAGTQCAVALRQRGFSGSIGLLGNEPELPYERPPLSKEYLSGAKTFDRLLIRPPAFWDDRGITMLLGREVIGVDPDAREVHTGDGERITYGDLVWATGGSPRRLVCSGHNLQGVHTIRSRSDVDRLISELPETLSVVVIGGGYIGLEAAAVLTKLGKSVTVLEAQERVLARVAGEPLSRFYEAEHRARGVDVRLGTAVDCIKEEDGRVSGVRLADGTILLCEMVIVGIGIIPAVGPLRQAGANGGNGVDVDEFCRTSLPHILAIGDCAAHNNIYAESAKVRVESIQNANDQAATAAKTIIGTLEAYDAVPWFWSNQFDLKLQTIGLSIGYDDLIVRGDPETRSFSVIYLRQGHVIALDCVNATKDFVQGRGLVVKRARCAKDRLADAEVSLKSLVSAE